MSKPVFVAIEDDIGDKEDEVVADTIDNVTDEDVSVSEPSEVLLPSMRAKFATDLKSVLAED